MYAFFEVLLWYIALCGVFVIGIASLLMLVRRKENEPLSYADTNADTNTRRSGIAEKTDRKLE
jgi:hypothetical protein